MATHTGATSTALIFPSRDFLEHRHTHRLHPLHIHRTQARLDIRLIMETVPCLQELASILQEPESLFQEPESHLQELLGTARA